MINVSHSRDIDGFAAVKASKDETRWSAVRYATAVITIKSPIAVDELSFASSGDPVEWEILDIDDSGRGIRRIESDGKVERDDMFVERDHRVVCSVSRKKCECEWNWKKR